MLNRKKLLLGIITLFVIVAIYYATDGSKRIIQESRYKVNHELTTLQQNGFTIEEREKKENSEHFTLNFSEPEKIAIYLKNHNLQTNSENITTFKGLKLAVDLKYLQDTYSLISVDIYPKAIPDDMVNILNSENPKILAHIEKMIADKSLLIHIDFNKLLSAFKGYTKDIDKTLKDEIDIRLIAKGMTFKGSIDNEKLKNLQQNIKAFSFLIGDKIDTSFSNLNTEFITEGNSVYSIKSKYSINKFKINIEKIFNMEILNIDGSAITTLKDRLLQSSVNMTSKSIFLKKEGGRYILKNSSLDAKIANLDIEAFEKLQTINHEDHEAINKLTQQILSRGIEFNISKLFSKEVTINDRAMGSFNILASGDIDKKFNVAEAEKNPLLILKAFNATTNLEVSPSLFSHFMQDPRAMIFMMLIPPQEKNGQKIYDISYNRGDLSINGVSF